jgi:tRNA(fMet)-specific endonuclease VapC
MLDTNTVSHLVKRHPSVRRRLEAAPMTALCISAITAAELRFGLAKRPDAVGLHRAVGEFLLRVDVLPWDDSVSQRYGTERADMLRQGRVLAPLDMLIAAHALDAKAVLVTSDRAFNLVAGLELEDWTQ